VAAMRTALASGGAYGSRETINDARRFGQSAGHVRIRKVPLRSIVRHALSTCMRRVPARLMFAQ
jgi:hypothetical protein